MLSSTSPTSPRVGALLRAARAEIRRRGPRPGYRMLTVAELGDLIHRPRALVGRDAEEWAAIHALAAPDRAAAVADRAHRELIANLLFSLAESVRKGRRLDAVSSSLSELVELIVDSIDPDQVLDEILERVAA